VIKDEIVTEMADALIVRDAREDAAARREIETDLKASPIEVLARPVEPPPVIVAGAPVRRAAPKVGRNDLCPCGSGKKYKRCHEGQDDAQPVAPADPSPVSGLSMDEFRARVHEFLKANEIVLLRNEDLATLRFDLLPMPYLERAAEIFTGRHDYDGAARVIEAIEARGGEEAAGVATRAREDLIQSAIFSGALDVLRREVKKDGDPEYLKTIAFDLELLDPGEETLFDIEDHLTELLRDDQPIGIVDVAEAMARSLPALAFVLLNGAVNIGATEPYLEIMMGRTRDRLLLEPGPLNKNQEEVGVQRWEEERRDARRKADYDELAGEERKLRARLEGATGLIEELEKKLADKEQQLVSPPPVAATSSAPAPVAPSPAEDEEKRRLRAKVNELKGLVDESHAERSRLKRELSDTEKRLSERAEPESPGKASRAEADDDGLEIDDDQAGTRRLPILVPMFSTGAAAALREHPARLARDALRTIAGLAGGDAATWRGIKRLQGFPDLYAARVGIHHRILFRLAPERGVLDVAAIVTRENLDTTLRRM
jgi:hypothetical protein